MKLLMVFLMGLCLQARAELIELTIVNGYGGDVELRDSYAAQRTIIKAGETMTISVMRPTGATLSLWNILPPGTAGVTAGTVIGTQPILVTPSQIRNWSLGDMNYTTFAITLKRSLNSSINVLYTPFK